MNSRQKEVLNRVYGNEYRVIKLLRNNYEMARAEINNEIKRLEEDGIMTESRLNQIKYQTALKGQMDTILDNMGKKNYIQVDKYLKDCYEDGFIGTMYDLQGQGVPLIFPIDQSQVVDAILNDTKLSKKLYESMGHDVETLKMTVNHEIARGISKSSTYRDIARAIKNRTGVGIGRSMTIARTEGHRIQIQATADAQAKAKKAGADVVKQWDSTLDNKTRRSHRELDGQLRELEDNFVIPSSGATAPHPSGFGLAREDINCRCALLQRARWALDDEEYTKMNGETNELVALKETNYESFKNSYKEATTSVKTVKDRINDIKSEVLNNKPTDEQLHKAGKVFMDDFHSEFSTNERVLKLDELRTEEQKYRDHAKEVAKKSEALYRQRDMLQEQWGEDFRALQEQISKLSDEQEQNRQQIIKYLDAQNTVSREVRGIKIDMMKKKLSDIVPIGYGNMDIDGHLQNSRSPMRGVVKNAYGYYPTSWVQKSVDYRTLKPMTVDRGYYSKWDDTIAISGQGYRATETAVHELGHRFEHVVPEILAIEREFYERRTMGEELQWLGGGYARDETSRFDKFIDKYMGKDYRRTAYELVSMGFEMAYSDPLRLMKDEDFAQWIFGIFTLIE